MSIVDKILEDGFFEVAALAVASVIMTTVMVDKEDGENKKEITTSEIASLVKKARGERSIRSYSNDSGVGIAIISRIENNDYNPSPEMIKKLTSKEANPQNGVTYVEMMTAMGYLDFDNTINQAITIDPKKSIKQAKSLIMSTLYSKNITFKENSNDREVLQLLIENNSISCWDFDFCFVNNEMITDYMDCVLIGKYAFLPKNSNVKTSIVLFDKEIYSRLSQYQNKLALNLNLSIVLIDLDNFEILSETILSNFERNESQIMLKEDETK